MTKNINTDSTGEKFQQLFSWLLPAVYFWGGGLLVAFVLNFYRHQISQDPGDWGVLGDYFGGLMNPVISFATLLVAYAVWKLQRVELDETKQALKDQAETAERQRQEQRFFDLLNVYYRTTDALRFDQRFGGIGAPRHTESFYGKDAISQWFLSQGAVSEFLRDTGQYHRAREATDGSVGNGAFLASLGREWADSNASERFGTLLRTIETVFSVASTLLTHDQRSYLELLKSQLSNSELSLIGYQLLFNEGSSPIRTHVERYGLFEHMTQCDLRSALEDRLPSSAFASMSMTPRQHKTEESPC